MSASVCQGLQSCLEPGFIEPRAEIDKLAPQRSSFSQSFPWPKKPNASQEQREQKDNSCKQNKSPVSETFGFDEGENRSNKDGDPCWSFMQVLANTSTCRSGKQASPSEEGQVYVPPLAKQSLSKQSLEMCTEGLGSETGSNSDEIIADLSCLSLEKQSSSLGIQRSRSREYLTKKLEQHGTFPPPLTLIGCSDGIQLRPHREGGRLVLKAVTFWRKSCFQAERTGGRLRLFSLSKDAYTNCDEEISQPYEDDKESKELEHENAAEEQDSREEGTDGGGAGSNYSEEEGTEGRFDCEIENPEEIPRPSRCKEEGSANRGLQISWEPFWVTIS